MAQLLTTSFKLTEGERDRLADRAERVGLPMGRLIRVALRRLDEVPDDELRAAIEDLPGPSENSPENA